LSLLQSFSSEIDKLRVLKKIGDDAFDALEPLVPDPDGGWTPELRKAAYDVFGERLSFETPWAKIPSEYSQRIYARLKEAK